MTAKEYLKQLWMLDREIAAKQDELEELQTKAESCSSPQLSDMPKSHNGSDSVGDTVVKIISLQNYINRKIDKLIDLRQTITEQIDGLENINHRVILQLRYIRHMDWLDIADEMSYSVQNCYIIHGVALVAFDKKYLNNIRGN